jgi:hypothetical protein
MRIKVIQQPTVACIDGVHLDQFRPGNEYQLGNLLACVFLAEGWAEPIDHPENGSHAEPEVPAIPRNLTREFFPPYYDGSPSALASEHASRRLNRRQRRR